MRTNPVETRPSFLALLAQRNDSVRFYCIQHYDVSITSEEVMNDLVFDQDLPHCDWRYREAIVLSMCPLLQGTQRLSPQYTTNLLQLYFAFFEDPVCSVRRQSSAVVGDVITLLGFEYASKHILPSLTDLYQTSKDYRVRSNLLYCYENVINSEGMRDHQNELCPLKRLILDELSVRFGCKYDVELYSKHAVYRLQGDREHLPSVHKRSDLRRHYPHVDFHDKRRRYGCSVLLHGGNEDRS